MSEEKRRVFQTPPILYEDNHLLVALKQPNLPVQQDSSGDMDMLRLLKNYVKEKYNKPGDAYLGLVHRMDRPVGGLLCFARTSKGAARLSQQIREGTLKREYVLVAEGQAPDKGTLRDMLVKDEETNMVTVKPSYLRQGKEAVLHFECVARKDEQSLIIAQLETGRAHQIRVQFAHAGLPLWGDNRYGKGVPGQQIALWGMRLSLNHPITQKPMVFLAPPPHEGGWEPWQREIQGIEAIWPARLP